MGHGLHQAQVALESVFNQFLAIAGNSGAFNTDPIATKAVYLLKLFQYNGDWVAEIGVVVIVKDTALRVNEYYFCSGRAGIDS